MVDLDEAYDLLMIWWDLYRIEKVSTTVDEAFQDIAKTCPYQVLDIATILHKSWSPNTPLVNAIINRVTQALFDNIPAFKDGVFGSEKEFEQEKIALIEELRYLQEKCETNDIYYWRYTDNAGNVVLS